MLEMYAPMVNSPITELETAIDDTQTTIEVVDGSKLPDAPNLAMIGLGENTETILYTQKDGNVLSGVTRGFQGVAKAWPQGTRVARFFAAYDQMAIQENIKTLDQSLAAHLNEIVTESVTLAGTDITALTTTDIVLTQNRKPKGIRIYATALWANRATSIGDYTQIGANNQCFFLLEDGLNSVSTAFIVMLGNDSNNYMGAKVTTLSGGRITFTWQKIGSPTQSNHYIIQVVAIYHD